MINYFEIVFFYWVKQRPKNSIVLITTVLDHHHSNFLCGFVRRNSAWCLSFLSLSFSSITIIMFSSSARPFPLFTITIGGRKIYFHHYLIKRVLKLLWVFSVIIGELCVFLWSSVECRWPSFNGHVCLFSIVLFPST